MDCMLGTNILEVCRTCLKYIVSTPSYSMDWRNPKTTIRVKHILNKCIPELDLNMTPNAVICGACYDAINFIYEFKLSSIHSEIRIHQHQMQAKYNSTLVDLAGFKRSEHSNGVTLTIENNIIETSDTVNNKTTFTQLKDLEAKVNEPNETLEENADYREPKYSSFGIKKELEEPDSNEVLTGGNSGSQNSVFIQMNHFDTGLIADDHLYIKTSRQVGNMNDFTNNFGKTALIDFSANKPYKCRLCVFECSFKNNLQTHMRIHTGEKPFKCPHCEYRCNVKSNLKSHMVVHSDNKQFMCRMCNFQCNWKSNLKSHMLLHLGEKPFKCALCEYQCTQKGNLNSHMRTHSGGKRFKCSFCDYWCNGKNNLKRHMIIHSTR